MPVMDIGKVHHGRLSFCGLSHEGDHLLGVEERIGDPRPRHGDGCTDDVVIVEGEEVLALFHDLSSVPGVEPLVDKLASWVAWGTLIRKMS
jgi:hypothetical protein